MKLGPLHIHWARSDKARRAYLAERARLIATQEQAAEQYRGSGLQVHMYGTPLDDATAGSLDWFARNTQLRDQARREIPALRRQAARAIATLRRLGGKPPRKKGEA